mmetsp:Transcript_14755/g.40767  ORF Transcript_14755/g.40767 Transcript_14755/m.40767 type:complete len:3812 (+) Transcript_14755:277-11712(+)
MPPAQYIAKHAFSGDPAQSQLNLTPGALVVAKPGQTGAWWWGSCNGKDGWFPPTYVAPAPSTTPPSGGAPTAFSAVPQQQQGMSMQQQMQQASFASSVQQRAPPTSTFGGGYQAQPQQHSIQPGIAANGRPQALNNQSDPFAGLENMSSPTAASATSPPAASAATTAFPTTQTNSARASPAPSSTGSTGSAPGMPIQPPVARSSPVPPSTASTGSSHGSLGVGGTSTSPPKAQRSFSPKPATSQPLASNPKSGIGSSPVVQPLTSPEVTEENFAGSATGGISSTRPPAHPGMSKEEEEARKLRAQEEARQKALLRKEKADMGRNDLSDSSSGIGSSGVAITATTAESTLGDQSSGPRFNPYEFLAGTGKLPDRKFSPVFRVPPFWALMNLNSYIQQQPVPEDKLKERASMYEQLARALSFVSYVCAETAVAVKKGRGRYATRRENPLDFLASNHMACEACIKLISLLPHSAGASGQQLDGLFMNFLNVFISLIEHVQPNQQLVLPGGWQQPEYTYLCLYIVRNLGNNKWSFTICNTGRDGLQYHPATFDAETGRELKQLSMTIWDIPGERLMDSTFWTLLFRLQVYPSRKNNAAFVYTKLLPALNSRPLLSNLDQGPAEYLEVPGTIAAQSYHPLALLALTSTPVVNSRPSKYSSLLVMKAAADLTFCEIEKAPPSSMDPEDTRILKLTGRNLANFAATINPNTVGDNSLGAALSDSWDLLDHLLKKINITSSKPVDQYNHGLSSAAAGDEFSQGKIVSLATGPGSAAYPLFGRLRRDNYEETMKNLMGDPRQDPILIPAVLTDEGLPAVATDYLSAASHLQRIGDACSLLLQQRRLVKNSPAFAASAAQHALTTILPMPNADPKHCFWRKNEMRRETQKNLLFLIRRICRIYSAATARVQQSRGLTAIRSTAFACAACVADAICRVEAIDDPSAFALHYSGLCEGPTEPFGIDAGAYDTLGANLPMYDPNICSLRFQCLDYMRGLSVNMDGSPKETIFNFDKSLSPTKGDLVLLDQLSIQLALPRPFPKTKEAMMNHSANLISGRNGSLIEVLPEFEYFRDIVFHFRHAVSGKAASEEVSESHTWLPSDATLHWDVRRTSKDDPTLLYHVSAFQGHQQEFVERIAQQESKGKNPFAGFLALFSGKSVVERSRLSSADPTTVVNSCAEKFLSKRAKPVSVRNEDDVLHLDTKELPTFGNILSPSDSERFIQFLTVPYIRIPLILDFFANGDPTRLAALRTKSLQLIVDAALFEPGRWKPADFVDYIKEVPVVDVERLESLLATPHGTLFNEIAKSPDVLTSCVIKILERALDMDVGRYTKKSSSGPLILYAVRLAVRLEGYMKYALRKCGIGKPRPRGLETLDNIKVEQSLKKIRGMIDSQAIPTLEYWIDPSRTKDVDISCLTHAHLLYLFKNYDYEDLDYRAVSILMSSQVYLTINTRFSSKVYDDLQDNSNPTRPPPSIQIAQSEVFDIIQTHRYNILRFIRERKSDGDNAMESVVRIATGTGTREHSDIELKERHWQSIGHQTCYGRFVPDTEDEKLRDGSYRKPLDGQSYEEWMLQVTTKAVGIEVNIQLSDFTLQNHKMALLDTQILEDADFAETKRIAMKNSSDIACAEVMHTTNRYWWRLVGRRYDVLSWSPDQRNYYDTKGARNPNHTRKFPGGLRGGEKWIADILKDKLPLILPEVTLYLPSQDLSDEAIAVLSGWLPNKRSDDSMLTHTLKEVVVWQHPPSLCVFNVVEYGRRHLRILEYTSNLSTCMHEVGSGEPYPDRVAGILSLSAGVPMTSVAPTSSLLVSRALSSEIGVQTFVPPRFLEGLLPTALVETYVFWQNEDDSVVGYAKDLNTLDLDEEDEEIGLPPNADAVDENDETPTTRLHIKLAKENFDKTGFCNSNAEALVQRIPVIGLDQESERVDKNRTEHTLLNVLTAPPSSLLKRIGMLLARLDNLAHVLVWSTSSVTTAHGAASIDLIELPRINLAFKAKEIELIDGTKERRLYSNDYDGLFIATSTEAREIAERLLGSISHFIVLQNADKDLFVLLPSCALPRRLHIDGSHLSVQVILDRRNREWIGNIGEVRSYLYPIHNSRSFLVTPSLASSLYLMLMYFITGAYTDVFKMVESCVSEDLTPEEQQIFNQLEFLGNDFHPDAHACRLKLSVVTVGLGADSTMRCPWSVTEEMEQYVKKHGYVSSACRLTTEEEMLLLQMCSPNAQGRLSLTLLNRKAFVGAVRTLGSLAKDKTLSVKLGKEKPPVIENFDFGADYTIIENPKKTMVSAKLFGAAYNRPEDEEVAYGGLKALEFINNAVSSGVEMTSARYGFPLLYDLLTETVAFKLHPSDRTFNWGRMLFRLVPPSDFKTLSAEMSILRILSENRPVASHPSIPRFQIESGMNRLKGMFAGKDAVSKLIEQSHNFMSSDGVRSLIRNTNIYQESLPRSTMILGRPESYSQHRLWVVPRISDYSNSKFYLDIQNCGAVNIPIKQLQAFATKPLRPIKLSSYVAYLTRAELGQPVVPTALPFDVSGDRATQTHCSLATAQRVADDVFKYSQKANTETTPTLIGFSPQDVDSFHNNPSALSTASTQVNKLIKALNQAMEFDRKSLWNLMNRALAIATSDERSDSPGAGGAHGEINFLRFRLGQVGEREPASWFELLVASTLSTVAEHDIRSLNPHMSGIAYKTVTSLTIVAMLTSIRISQTHRALSSLSKLLLLVRRVNPSNTAAEQSRICKEIQLQSTKVAGDVANERHFMTFTEDNNYIMFDPRFLVFEFTYSLMLRKSQVLLVNKLMNAIRNGQSMCHQMIMGAGKTTVVTPLLAMMLADGESLVTQVVPHALLDFSRGVMREKFAAVVRKPVFTFNFSRGTPITRDLYLKLCKARDSKAIICATPTSVKSFMLKFVEMMKILEEKKFGEARRNARSGGFFGGFSLSSIAKRFRDSVEIVETDVNPQEVYYGAEILKLFKSGALLLDEVDLLLHPLKSELNWPVGHKDPIDYSRGKLGAGLRWDLFWHLIDGIFFATTGKMSVAFKDSREALSILEQISSVIQRGIAEKQMQQTPHLVLLNRKFYHAELKPLMARWQLIYLRNKRLPSVEDKHLIAYMADGPLKNKAAASAVHVALDDEYMKMLNLSHDLLRNFLPHVMSKINRVSFGLLSKQDLKQALELEPNISLARRLAAIPFVGKDIPSRASQFSHPDIVIGLTINAYRYEGLRFTDFENVLFALREQLDSEFGPYHKRPAALLYKSWVEAAGGKVRGPREGEADLGGDNLEASFFRSPMNRPGVRGSDDLWPLHLLDLKDEQHMSVTYNLLRMIPQVINYYLHGFVFPLIMEHHHEKISASGQDLGGEMIFGRRVGFSGTPSDLLPEELGQCQYDEGVDGQIIHFLTSLSIVGHRLLPPHWSVNGMLNDIATADPPFHALLDCGALVTGMSNYDVAKYLLTNGLSSDFDGVVFLDHKDRKMILMRQGMNVVRLNQSGIPPHRRFSFYDQIHTTGMDIHQCIDARAALTLGKDMTFRDYAQGAFRMRGIGKGQTIELFIIPEVMKLINDQMSGAAMTPPVAQPVALAPPAAGGYGADLLSMSSPAFPQAQTTTPEMRGSPQQLLVDVAAWLTVNGMRSENMQFRMLCHQSIDNVSRKRAFEVLTGHYRELTQVAFAGRAKEFMIKGNGSVQADIEGDLDMDVGNSGLLADDSDAILTVVDPRGNKGSRTVGTEFIQKSLDILSERLDFTVPNSIPVPVPLSDILRNSIMRRQEFIRNDYDKAVIDKILMVLVNSEGLTIKKFGDKSKDDQADEDVDANIQKEQVAEEEVLKEQEEEEEEEEE